MAKCDNCGSEPNAVFAIRDLRYKRPPAGIPVKDTRFNFVVNFFVCSVACRQAITRNPVLRQVVFNRAADRGDFDPNYRRYRARNPSKFRKI